MQKLDLTHIDGTINLHNIEHYFMKKQQKGKEDLRIWEGNFGLQIAWDGRVWVCLDGIPILRFVPKKGAEKPLLEMGVPSDLIDPLGRL